MKKVGFPGLKKVKKIHKTLSFYSPFRCNDVPLPQWLISGRDGKLSCFSLLDNLPAYPRTFAENENIFLKEMMTQQFYKSKNRKPYSPQFL